MSFKQKHERADIFNAMHSMTPDQELEEKRKKKSTSWITKVGNFQLVKEIKQNSIPNPSNMYLLMEFIAPIVDPPKDEQVPYTISNMTDLGPSSSGSLI